MTALIETGPHEFTVNYNFNSHGLRPYFALDRALKSADSWATRSTFRHSGEKWYAKLHKRDASGLVHPGDTTPGGTPFRIDEVREYGLRVGVVDDPHGRRSFYAHIRPRWEGQQAEKKGGRRVSIPVPDGFGDGVNVRIQGSNIEFDEYQILLQRAAESVGVNRSYFGNSHDSSNVQDAARYVRLNKDVSGPIHARDGPLVGLAHLLENDREGYRKLVQNDSDNHGRRVPGWYHTVTLGPERIRECWPNHALPKEVKHYYAKEAFSRDPDDPLAHPKLEVSYQASRWDETLHADSDSLRQLNKELDESLLSVLADSGLDVRPGGGVFIEDDYWTPEISDRNLSVVSLDLTEIRHEQESVVVRQLADGLSPIAWETIKLLVTDGGHVTPQDIAESGGFHRDSVYRTLSEMGDLIEREYNQVSLRSTYVAELLHETVKEARDAARRAIESGTKVLQAADRGLDQKTQEFLAWTGRYDLNCHERDGGVSIRFGRVKADSFRDGVRQVKEKLREGYPLWLAMNRDGLKYRMGRFSAKIEYPEHSLRSIEAETATQPYTGTIWETALRSSPR